MWAVQESKHSKFKKCKNSICKIHISSTNIIQFYSQKQPECEGQKIYAPSSVRTSKCPQCPPHSPGHRGNKNKQNYIKTSEKMWELRAKSANCCSVGMPSLRTTWPFCVACEDEPATYFGKWTKDPIVSSCGAAFSSNSRTHMFQMWQFGQATTLTQRCWENVNTGQSIKAAKWVCTGFKRVHLMSWCEFALRAE